MMIATSSAIDRPPPISLMAGMTIPAAEAAALNPRRSSVRLAARRAAARVGRYRGASPAEAFAFEDIRTTRRLGGQAEGAYLLVDGGGRRVVLKVASRDADGTVVAYNLAKARRRSVIPSSLRSSVGADERALTLPPRQIFGIQVPRSMYIPMGSAHATAIIAHCERAAAAAATQAGAAGRLNGADSGSRADAAPLLLERVREVIRQTGQPDAPPSNASFVVQEFVSGATLNDCRAGSADSAGGSTTSFDAQASHLEAPRAARAGQGR